MFIYDLHHQIFQCCSFSPCGRFLAAGTNLGELVIWDVETQDQNRLWVICIFFISSQIIFIHRLKAPDSNCQICSVSWNPEDNNNLSFSTTTGFICVLKEATIKKIKEGVRIIWSLIFIDSFVFRIWILCLIVKMLKKKL